jgi:hypothetical protein
MLLLITRRTHLCCGPSKGGWIEHVHGHKTRALVTCVQQEEYILRMDPGGDRQCDSTLLQGLSLVAWLLNLCYTVTSGARILPRRSRMWLPLRWLARCFKEGGDGMHHVLQK